METELHKLLTENAAEIIAASVKPMEAIDSIRIVSTGQGLMAPAIGGAAGGGGESQGGLPNQLVQALMQYRMQTPVIDQLLREVGINPANPSELAKFAAEAEAPEQA